MTLQNGTFDGHRDSHVTSSFASAMEAVPMIDAYGHECDVGGGVHNAALETQKQRQQLYSAPSAASLPRDGNATVVAASAVANDSSAFSAVHTPSDKPTLRGFKGLKKRFSNSFSRLSVHHPNPPDQDPYCAPPHPRPAALRLMDAEAAAAFSASPDAYDPSTSVAASSTSDPLPPPPPIPIKINAVVRPDSFAPSSAAAPPPPSHPPPNSGSFVSVGDFSPSDDISPSQAMSYVNSSNNTLNEDNSQGYCESNSFNMENSSNSVAAAAALMTLQQINARPIGTSGSYLMTQSMTIDASDFSDPVTTPSDVVPPSVGGGGGGGGNGAGGGGGGGHLSTTPTRANKRHSWIKRLISSAKAKALVKQSRATWSLEGHLDDLGHSRGSLAGGGGGGGGGGRDKDHEQSTKAATLSRDVSQDEICDRLGGGGGGAQQHRQHPLHSNHRASEAGDLDGLDSTGGSPKSIPSTPKSENRVWVF